MRVSRGKENCHSANAKEYIWAQQSRQNGELRREGATQKNRNTKAKKERGASVSVRLCIGIDVGVCLCVSL